MNKKTISQALLDLLGAQARPLSVPQIQNLLAQKKITPNKTSLYRALEKLKEAHEIEEILIDSKTTFYEKVTSHHHHFTCNECETITCLDDQSLESEIHESEHKLNEQGFKILNHQFSFSGICSNCH